MGKTSTFAKEIAEKLLNKKDGLCLVISVNEQVNPNLLQKAIKILENKFNINKKNVIIAKDPENDENIPVFIIFSKTKQELKEQTFYVGYNSVNQLKK